MCNVKNLNEEERRVNLHTKNGEVFSSPWYIDDDKKVDGLCNCTEKEIAAYNDLLVRNNLTDDDVEMWSLSRRRQKGNVYISEHAFDRMKERCGWNRKAATRMVEKVYEKGQNADDVKGYLAPWIKQRKERQTEGEIDLIYGNFLYVFNADTLITVIHVPQKGKVNYA